MGAPGVSESTATLNARQQQRDLQGPSPTRRMPLLRPDRRGLPQESVATAAPSAVTAPQQQSVGSFAPQVLATSFTAATLADCSGYPPDTMGVVGPTQFIIALNGRIRSFSKATGVADGAINITTDTFFTSVATPGYTMGSTNFTTDPRIRYDRLSGRWFISMIDVPGNNGAVPNRVMLAMSDSGSITPSTVWTYFFFQADTAGVLGLNA